MIFGYVTASQACSEVLQREKVPELSDKLERSLSRIQKLEDELAFTVKRVCWIHISILLHDIG